MVQPCHAEGLVLMLLTGARRGDIVPVLLPPNAAAISNPLITNANAVSQIPMDGFSQMPSSLLGV